MWPIRSSQRSWSKKKIALKKKKVITKVLVNKFLPLLMKVVGPLQGSFIPGQGTKDNILLAQEVMHTIQTYKKRGGLVALKVDLEKAYDQVS